VILEKFLQEAFVPTDLNFNEFQAMFGYLAMSHHVTFEQDFSTQKYDHNYPLHLEVYINKAKVK
jgi:hypothetical protein